MTSKDAVNILLVDDQPGKLLTYEVILQDLGENLIKAQSAGAALEQLLRNDIAVVLVDVCMPDLDGFELVSMIRDHPRYQDTAIIFISAIHLSDLDRLRGYEAGAVDYIPVPVVPDILRAKVKVFAELHRKTRELARLTCELEQRVAERTAELARLNAELERRVEERTAQLVQLQKTEALGQITGGVAHDFNNLLAVIGANLGLLRRRLPDDPKLRALLEGAMQGAERGAALTRRMLAFARKQELKPEPVDVAALVAGMDDMLRRSLGPLIRIDTRFPPTLPRVYADPHQLELAILNLAVNARDAMAEGGVLRLSAVEEIVGPAGAGSLGAGHYIRLTVADDGVGMDAATLGRAAEPFFTTKGVGKGTGLGLSMVQGLVAQSGGILDIRSQPGQGTQVDLWLPRSADPAACAPPSVCAVASAPPALTLLLVDDDQLLRAALAAQLDAYGQRVLEAPSGAQALSILAANPAIDLLITDHLMPAMTGAQLIREARRHRPGLPAILATGFAELPPGDEQLLRLQKPFSIEELLAAMARAMESAAVEPACDETDEVATHLVRPTGS